MAANDPEKIVDLRPHEWRSEREKPREPILGPGWPHAVSYVLCTLLTFALSYYIRTAWIDPHFPSPTRPALEVGQSTIFQGVKITRVN